MHRILSSRSLMVAAAIALAPFALQAQTAATITCKDGTTSTATGRGACSGHGGVDKSAAKAAKSEAKSTAKSTSKATKAEAREAKADTKADSKAATKSAKSAEKATSKAVSSDVKETGKSATRTASNSDPTNATAKCKDGTYSHAATHRGACSRHGGVAEWLKS